MTIDFQLDIDKTREAIVYLVSRSKSGFEKYIIIKLLFLADKYHLVRYGRPITGDQYFAMPHGPAPNRILDLLNLLISDPDSAPALSSVLDVERAYRYPRFVAKRSLPFDNLSQSDMEALDETLSRFGSKEFQELKTLTHDMLAYKKAWRSRGHKNAARMDFQDFFEEDPDAIAGVLEEVIEDSKLRRVFPG